MHFSSSFGALSLVKIEATSNFPLYIFPKSQTCVSVMGAVSPSCSGEKSHADCVLIYKSETEGDRDHTPDTDFLGFPTKMLTVKRLGRSNACYHGDQLEKMALFQCMEEVEKCFLEESSGEQDSRSGKNQVSNACAHLSGGVQILCCHRRCRIKEALGAGKPALRSLEVSSRWARSPRGVL